MPSSGQGGGADGLSAECRDILGEQAGAYARLALANIAKEFPSLLVRMMNSPGDFPNRPADRTPVFYGSLDWHSCVEMHWLLVRLLRLAGPAVPADEIMAALDAQFTAGKLAAEARFVASDDGRFERPYGWAWALALVHEIASLDDAGARRWLAAITPLADALTKGFLDWLPKATYPVRSGVHPNSAFSFSVALPFAARQAQQGRPELAAAIEASALGWFEDDADYPGQYEPSGHDFLSPALTEAELMSRLLAQPEFAAWLAQFLPGVRLAAHRGEPARRRPKDRASAGRGPYASGCGAAARDRRRLHGGALAGRLRGAGTELTWCQPGTGIRAAKASTLCCQPSSSGPLSPVTNTLSSATSTSPLPCRTSFMIGRTRCPVAINSSSVGTRPVFLSGRGAASVVKMAYLVPAGSTTFFRNWRIPRMGLPKRPGELNRYKSAAGKSSGLASRM